MEKTYLKSLNSQLQFWEHFALFEKLSSLQQNVATVVKSQEASAKSRKELASKTKEIRSISAGERINFMKGLLKLYQDEIDKLTMRSQFSENLLASYLADMNAISDPTPLMEESKSIFVRYNELIDDSERMDSENTEMRQQLESLRSKSNQNISVNSDNEALRAEIVNQKKQYLSLEESLKQYSYSSIIKNRKDSDLAALKNSLTSLSNTHDENIRLQLQIATLEKEINENYSLTVASGRDTDGSRVMQQMSRLREELAIAQSEQEKQNDICKVLGQQSRMEQEKHEQETEALESQVTLLNGEVEQQATRIEELEKELRAMRPIQEARTAISSEDVTSLVSDLRRSLVSLKSEKEAMERKWMDEKATLLSQHDTHVAELEQQLHDINADLRTRVGTDEMQRIKTILFTLQKVGVPVEFNEDSDLPIPDAENVLLTKIQHLETSNSNLRATFNEIYNKYMQSENDRHSLEEKVEDFTLAQQRMENQIASLEHRLIGGVSDSIEDNLLGGNVEMILKDQRDRYKKRVDELESERNRDKASLDSLYSVVNTLKKELNDKKGASRDPYSYDVTSKFHYSGSTNNPLEKISFQISQELVRSSRVRFFVSIYIIFVHLLLVFVIIRNSL